MKSLAIICDLDGTLCNTDHRQHLVKAKKWPEFYEALVYDRPNEWCVSLLKAMAKTHKIIYVSGRPKSYKDETMAWIERFVFWRIDAWPYELHMRKEDDFRKDSIVKTEIYTNDIEPNWAVEFCIDDRKQVVDAWRALGLVCLQCAEGNF